MDSGEIVVHEVQSHRMTMVVDLFRESIEKRRAAGARLDFLKLDHYPRANTLAYSTANIYNSRCLKRFDLVGVLVAMGG